MTDDGRVVAVTGVHSFAGAQLLNRLAADAAYARVLALDIRKPAASLDKVVYHKLDLTMPAADAGLAELLERERVETVVHAAFLSSPTHAAAWAHELEDVGTMHVLSACAEARVKKLVVASTTLVYGAGAKNPGYLDEDAELPQSRTPFLGDKIGAERQVARFAAAHPGTVVTVLRVAPTLGPTVQNFVATFFSRLVAPALLGFDPLLQLVHEDDVGDAFKLAVDEDAPGVFNIAGDGVLPYSTVRALMGKLTLPLPHFVARPLARALWTIQVADAPAGFVDFMRFTCVADTARARRQLGFAPRHDIRSTILDFLGVQNDEITGRTAVRRA